MTIKNKTRIIFIYAIRIMLRIFYVFPLKGNKIIFSSYGGSQITCNPYYVYKKLIDLYPQRYDIYWLSKEKYTNRIRKEDKIITPKGIKFLYHLLTASVIVDNDGFKSYIPIRRSQCYINTWHGGGLFKSAYGGTRSEEEIAYSLKVDKIKNGSIKILVSTSVAWTATVARYRFNYKGEILESGYPRNDLFFQKKNNCRQKINEVLKIGQNYKIVLFAPTFRGGLFQRYDGNIVNGLDVMMLLDNLRNKFGGEYKFVYRGHHAVQSSQILNGVIDASLYPDMQELLYVADVLISDYSSCLWDFSLTFKPCFIYAQDFDEYVISPGFESDYKRWPFPIAKNSKELLERIKEFDLKKYKKDVEVYHKSYGSFEEGYATEKVVSRIELALGNHE